MQWRIEVDVLKKDMHVIQQRCQQLVMYLSCDSTKVFHYKLEEPILHSLWWVAEGFFGYISPKSERI